MTGLSRKPLLRILVGLLLTLVGFLVYVLFMHSTFYTERRTLWPEWQRAARIELAQQRLLLEQDHREFLAQLAEQETVAAEAVSQARLEVSEWRLTLDALRHDSEVLSRYRCR